jgi:uncharacterized protein YutE (UPF0331/DUF86 family)
MDIHQFERLRENMKKNITELKSILNDQNVLNPSDPAKYDRGVYLFQSTARSMITVGNDIIIENDLRSPLNPADVFISLAEHNLLSSSIVVGMKKAAMAMPKITEFTKQELVDIMADSVRYLSKCLESYAEYFQAKQNNT